MASKFLCSCGHTVRINLFEGHGIYHLVTDNEIDALKDPINVEEVTDLWFKSPEMIKCKGCGCIYLRDQDRKEYVQYQRVSE